MKNAIRVVVLFSIVLTGSLVAAEPSLLVVEVHESKASGNLWYHVGIVDPLAKTILWGASHKYDKGHLPMVAVDGLEVVEVHQGLEKKDVLASMTSGGDVMKAPRLFYHAGTVNIGTKTISWGESHKYDRGRWPSVALEAQVVTEVHQAKGGEFLWYHVGNLDPLNKTIEWGPSTQYDRGWFSAVDVDGAFVVEAHRSLSKRDKWTDETILSSGYSESRNTINLLGREPQVRQEREVPQYRRKRPGGRGSTPVTQRERALVPCRRYRR